GVDLRLHFLGDHRCFASWASDVARRAGLPLAGPDSSSVPDPHGRGRDSWRLVDGAGLIGELRTAVPILTFLELHLPCNHRPGVVHPPTKTAGYPTALPGRLVPLGAGPVPGGDDGTGPEHPPGAARRVTARGRDGGAGCPVLPVAPTYPRSRKPRNDRRQRGLHGPFQRL